MLKVLGLQNYKCFHNRQDFDLSKYNIFTGYNGRGKSSVFQSILLLGQTISKFKNIEELEINGEYVRLGTFKDLKNCIAQKEGEDIIFYIETDNKEYKNIELGYKNNQTKERFGLLNSLKINGKDFFSGKNASFGVKDGERQVDIRTLIDYPRNFFEVFSNIDFVSANRLGPVPYEEKDDLDDTNPIGCRGEHLLTYLSRHKDVLDRVNNWLDKIMDGGKIVIRGGIDSKVLSLDFQTNYTNKSAFSSINCGYGYSYILPIIVDAVTMNNGMILIENPEAHLHPKAQSEMMKMLCSELGNKDVQVFIETHSEHILNGMRLQSLINKNISNQDCSLYFFDKDFMVKHLKMDERGQIDNWPVGFFDQQEKDLSQILKKGLLHG